MSHTDDASGSFVREGLAWRAAGAGHPVLLLHGIPDSGRAWDGVMAALAPRYRCLAPDLPGFGASAPAARLAGLDDVRGIMDAIVARLAPSERFTLAVHDVGGVFGLAWAAARPERIHRLVILNTSVFPDRRWHWGARVLRTPLIGDVAIRLMSRRAFRAQMRRASNHNLTDAAIDATLNDFGPVARRTALRLYRMQDPDLFRGLPEDVRRLTGEVPALVIWGERDPYLPVRFAERFGASDVRLHRDLGHWPHREAPDQVSAEIDAFLKESTDSGLRAE